MLEFDLREYAYCFPAIVAKYKLFHNSMWVNDNVLKVSGEQESGLGNRFTFPTSKFPACVL
jgi:hypothetical protein